MSTTTEALKSLVAINPAILTVFPTEDKEILKEAVKHDTLTVLENLSSQGIHVGFLIDDAVEYDGLALQYSNAFNEELCLKAVRQNGLALQYVPEVFCTEDVIRTAIENNSRAIEYCPTDTAAKFWIMALEEDINNAIYLKKVDIEVLKYLMRKNGNIFNSIFHTNKDILKQLTAEDIVEIISVIEPSRRLGTMTKKEFLETFVDYRRHLEEVDDLY